MATIESVLIIDDEIDLCTLLSLYFKKEEIPVQCASSLTEARRLLTTIHPSVVFLDNNLPDGLGIELIPQLKADALPTVIVVITGYNADQVGKEAFQHGVDLFMEKPFGTHQINAIVHAIKEQLKKDI